MIENIPQTGSNRVAALLAEMNEQGGFPIAIVTDRQGFPIASATSSGHDPQNQAAVVALIQKTAIQVRDQLGMAQTDEISLYDESGRRLVCRPFKANGHEMILAILVPDKKQSYRRLTNKVMEAIRQQWGL